MTAASDDSRSPGTGGHLLVVELAERWRISPRTLERWRAGTTGPAWLRLGGRVLYRYEDVVAYERAHLHSVAD